MTDIFINQHAFSPNMKKYFQENIPKIDKAVNEFFPREVSESWIRQNISEFSYSFDLEAWKRVCSGPFYELFDRGGKRLRPLLTILIHDALKGSCAEVHQFAIISEIIHSGTLIVDDIEDNSKFRRGKPPVHKVHGINISINNGYFLSFFPQLIIKQSNLNEEKKAKLYNTIVEEMTRIHIGQGMDLLWSQEKQYGISLDEYLQMCAYKTGALLRIAMKIGAILADAPEEILAKLEELAASMGIAFQIQDDILNLKPTGEWGKETGEDITEGKLTYMSIDVMSQADEEDKKELARILAAAIEDKAEIQKAIDIMDKYDSFSRAHKFSEQLIESSKKIVNESFGDSEYKRVFLEILDYVITRRK